MKDAFGGVLSLVLITIFLVIVSGILALLVNYTKAFRMKNVVISTIEQYSGAAGCFKDGSEYGCSSKIKEEAQKFGYSPTVLRCPEGYDRNYDLFCSKKSDSTSGKNKVYSIDFIY